MRRGILLTAGAMISLAGHATAGITDPGQGSGSGASAGSTDFYSNNSGGGSASTRAGGSSSVVAGDTASVSLQMFGSKGTVLSINALGNVSVKRGTGFAMIGDNVNGLPIGPSTSKVMAAWDEIVDTSFNTISLVIKSSDGQDLFPAGLVNRNDPDPLFKETFDIWTWNFGVTDAVTWRNNAAAAPLLGAEFRLSRDGGQTFVASASIKNLANPWNGKDMGTAQVIAGEGINFIQLTYRVGQVPTPGAMGLAGLCTLVAAHRRRR